MRVIWRTISRWPVLAFLQVWHVRSAQILLISLFQTLNNRLINFESEQSRPQTANRLFSEIDGHLLSQLIFWTLAPTDFKDFTEHHD
jgi:hypothetical protein